MRRYAEVQSLKSKVQSQESGVQQTQHPAYTAVQHPAPRNTHHASLFYLLSLGCFALALMSKAMLVTLPFVFLLLDYWPLRRFQLPTLHAQRSTLGRLVWEKAPFFAISVASAAMGFLLLKHAGAIGESAGVRGRAPPGLHRLRLSGLPQQDGVARESGVPVPPPGPRACGGGPSGGNAHRTVFLWGIAAAQAPSLCCRGLVLVSGRPAAGQRRLPIGTASHGRPLYLFPIHRLLHCVRPGAWRTSPVAGAGARLPPDASPPPC